MEILIAVLIGAVIWNCVVIERLIREFRWGMREMEDKLPHTRQTQAASKVSSTGIPRVDSRGRTSRRDSNDIPTQGGRMTKLTHKRNPDDIINSDRGFPNHAGHSPA